MIVRAIDSGGDWLCGKGRNDYKSKNAAIAQKIQTRLMSFLGNCVFDLSAGIDWFTFLGGSKDKVQLTLSVSSVILNTTDSDGTLVVTGIKNLVINLDEATRKITIEYAVITIYSVVTDTFYFDANGIV